MHTLYERAGGFVGDSESADSSRAKNLSSNSLTLNLTPTLLKSISVVYVTQILVNLVVRTSSYFVRKKLSVRSNLTSYIISYRTRPVCLQLKSWPGFGLHRAQGDIFKARKHRNSRLEG